MSKDEDKKNSQGAKVKAAVITADGVYEVDPTEFLEALRRRLENMGIGRDTLIAAIQQVCEVDPNDCDMSQPMSPEQMEKFFDTLDINKTPH